MQAGRLRHPLIFRRRIETPSGTGSVSVMWEDAFPPDEQPYGEVLYLRGRELFAAQQVGSKVIARATIYASAQVDARMQMLHNGEIFNVESVLPDSKSGREYKVLDLTQGLNQG